jgi:ABC-type multidrug transport system permease subunit
LTPPRPGDHDAVVLSSFALYPAKIMPGWLEVISKINPLTYEVEALRGLLIGTETTLWLDVVVLVGATVVAITCAALLRPWRRDSRHYGSRRVGHR